MTTTPVFVDEQTMRLGDIDLHCAYPLGRIPPGRLAVMKTPEMVERYVELCAQLGPRRIVELGINLGGSTAMLAELTEPDVLVAIELSPDPLPLLAEYIITHQRGASVRPHYGVDQADRPTVAALVDDARGDALLDLVVDDASHAYEPSRDSFETLFPRLRPGGVYVIEDWSWEHRFAEGIRAALERDSEDALRLRGQLQAHVAEEDSAGIERQAPLSRLVIELLQVRALEADVVRELAIDAAWVRVVRGDVPLPLDGPWLGDAYTDHFGQVAGARPARSDRS